MAKYQHGGLPAGVWEDGCVIPPSAINPTGPSGSMSVITSTEGYTGCLQADAVGESMTVNFQIPHSYMSDTNVHPHIHVVRNDGADNTGKVEFTARFRHCPLHGTAGAWSADIAGSTGDAHPADGAGETGLVSWVLASTDYSFGISDVICCIVQRSGLETGSVVITSADLHVQKAQYGSIEEATLGTSRQKSSRDATALTFTAQSTQQVAAVYSGDTLGLVGADTYSPYRPAVADTLTVRSTERATRS